MTVRDDSLVHDSTEASDVLFGDAKFGLVQGDAATVLAGFPDECIDMVITSPPYWQLREYSDSTHPEAVGMEDSFDEYTEKLAGIFAHVKRVLKPTGSLWLNLGDKYRNKRLLGIPWLVALKLQEQGWILRNEVIWNQSKGSMSSRDRLRMNRESIFHFVKQPKYFYSREDVLIKPSLKPTFKNGKVISATGVSGEKYRQQIIGSESLNEKEKEYALAALDETLMEISDGSVVDFRMTVRGQQRVLHGDSARLSGRAKELADKGFYIVKSRAEGYMPNDIWNIAPEDEWRKDSHCAVFPVALLEIPIKATCPNQGILLDPFVGTGSSIVAGLTHGKRAIGIDISHEYIEIARSRIAKTNTQFI